MWRAVSPPDARLATGQTLLILPMPPTATPSTQTLLPGQALILDAGFRESGQSWLLDMPTGSGKTWLAAQAIDYALQQGRRAIYVAPIKALTQNQYTDWCYQFGTEHVAILDSDHELKTEALTDVRLLVTTPESLESCLRQPQGYLPWIRQLSLVVVDEIDLIGDGWRGARLEGAIIALQLLNPVLRIVGITATLGDESDLRHWLSAAFVRTTHRAVPLEWQQIRFWTAAEKQSRAVQYIGRAVSQGHQCLVFCQSRQRTEILMQALQARGIDSQCHHAGRDPQERVAVEAAFQAGKTAVLCATATLAMGVNLPAREVIIYDTQRPDGNGSFGPLPRRELIQMAGRAGRPGFDARGTVTVLIHEKEVDYWRDTHRQAFQPLQSALADPTLLTERILTAINGQYAVTLPQLRRFLGRTLAAQQGCLPAIAPLLEAMQTAGMVICTDGKLTTTSVSDLAVRHYLQPATASHLQRLLQVEAAHLFDLLLGVCGCPDFTPLLFVRQEQVTQAEQCLETVTSTLLLSEDTLETHLPLPQGVLVQVIYTACVLHTWTVYGDIQATAQALSCPYAQDVQKGVESAQRLLEALLELCTVTDRVSPSTVARLAALVPMVTHGFTAAESTLLAVPGVTPTTAKRLIAHGVHSAQALGQTEPQALAQLKGFSRKRKTIIRYAQSVATQLPDLSEPHHPDHSGDGVRTLRRLWIKAQTNWNR